MSLYVIKSVGAARPCRVRLYEDENAAYNDFNRPATEAPKGSHGVILDVNLEHVLYWRLTPLALTTKDPTNQCKMVVEPPTGVTLDIEKIG